MKRRVLVRLIAILSLPAILSGCMLFNPTKRRPLDEISFQRVVPQTEQIVVIRFAEVVQGKPLYEIVWDNKGALWDVKESKQIGFTQNYVFATFPTGAGGVGGTAVNKGTRIVVPFGRYFTDMIGSAVKKGFSEAIICYDTPCVENALQNRKIDSVITLQIKSFKLWETFPNKINYEAEIEYSNYNKKSMETIRSGKVKKIMTGKSIGSFLSTSYSVIANMKDITANYTEELVSDVIKEIAITN